MPADDHTNAVDGTAAAGVRGPSSCLAHGKCAYSGVFTSTQYGPEAGRLHGADEPDDVQLTLAGQFALRPSMFQEVGIGEGPVVQLHGGRAGRRAHRRRPPPRRACAATDPAEFDLHKLQPAAAQRRPHLARVGPRLTCPREILDVQTDSGEPGSRRGLAALGEGVSWGFTESRAVQREETGDRVG